MRTLRRPMFRIGGSAGSGITSGLAPRKRYEHGGSHNFEDQVMGDWLRTATLGDIKKFAKESRYQPRGTNVWDFLTETGLNLVSSPPSGNIFQTVATEAKEPYQRFMKRKGEAEAAGYVSESDMFKTLIGAQADVLGGEGAKTYAKTEIAKTLRELSEKVMDRREEISRLEGKEGVTGAPIPGGTTGVDQTRINELKKQNKLDQITINNLKSTNPYAAAVLKSESFTQPLLDSIMNRLVTKEDAAGNRIYKKGLEDEKLLIDAYAEFRAILEGVETQATGGRVGYATAGPVMGQGMPTQMPTPADTMPEELGGITYEELRARLPQEVSDEVVRLLANSPEALEDFAVIQTEQDIANFNKKYGVNLVLPAEA